MFRSFAVLYDMMTFGPFYRYQRFGGICYRHLQGVSVKVSLIPEELGENSETSV
jgi:hypothetical protein